jgi:hypothetical protein
MYYESPRYVRIHGKSVHFIYNLLMVLLVVINAGYLIMNGQVLYFICVCSVLHALIYTLQYMNIDRVTSGHIFSFLEEGDSEMLSVHNLPYCNDERIGYSCEIVDAQELVQSSGGKVFVRTSRRYVDQTRTCPATAQECRKPLWESESAERQETWLSVTPELNYLVLEHSLHRSVEHDDLLAGSSRLYPGTFSSQQLKLQEEEDGMGASMHVAEKILQFPPGNSSDRISLSDLLAAGGVYSLDDESDFVGATSRSFRETGVALELYITYTNLAGPSLGPSHYTYEVTRVPMTRVRRLTTESATNSSRVMVSSAGISISIHLSGNVGAWGMMSVINGVLLPSVSMTAVVYTLMYYVIMLVPHFRKQRQEMIRGMAEDTPVKDRKKA